MQTLLPHCLPCSLNLLHYTADVVYQLQGLLIMLYVLAAHKTFSTRAAQTGYYMHVPQCRTATARQARAVAL